MSNKSRNKVLFLSIVLFCLMVFVINFSKPDKLFFKIEDKPSSGKIEDKPSSGKIEDKPSSGKIEDKKKNNYKPIPFGYGENKKIVCVYSICLMSPLVLYLFLSLIY
jgi:hypothetical protein